VVAKARPESRGRRVWVAKGRWGLWGRGGGKEGGGGSGHVSYNAKVSEWRTCQAAGHSGEEGRLDGGRGWASEWGVGGALTMQGLQGVNEGGTVEREQQQQIAICDDRLNE
jgi:hypothetical protein